jgi:hypothetical protein
VEIPPEDTVPEEPLSLPDWLKSLDEEMSASAASAAEGAFGMGCMVSLVPMVIVLGISYLLGARHWVSLFIVGLIVLFLAIVWSVYVALQAHRKGPPRIWRESVKAKTEAGLEARGIAREQFIAEVNKLFPESAPLRRAVHGEFE